MQDWVQNEIEACEMADKRLVKRLGHVLDRLGSDPERSIPAANDSWAEIQGAYRFLSNSRVSSEDILSGHRAATLRRVQQEQVVLVAQDTTFFSFARQRKNEKLGTIKTLETDPHLLHVSAAFTPERVNLGVIGSSLWQRAEKGPAPVDRYRPIEEKESVRWLEHYRLACSLQSQCPETTVVSIADREGDIHEWFALAEQIPLEAQAAYIIRAKCNRRIELENGDFSTVWEHLPQTKKLGSYELTVPARGNQPERVANVAVHVKAVTLVGKAAYEKTPVEVFVVLAKEENPPQGTKGIEWVLVTNLAVEDYGQARTVIEWYRARWEIEVFFRVLKGGCQAEYLRLETVDRRDNALAVYLIVAWHIHNITMFARAEASIRCDRVFSDIEWKTILLMKDKKRAQGPPPSLYEVTRKLAQLGGFIGRKGDGEPGVKAIWIGYQRLMNYIEVIATLEGL